MSLINSLRCGVSGYAMLNAQLDSVVYREQLQCACPFRHPSSAISLTVALMLVLQIKLLQIKLLHVL